MRHTGFLSCGFLGIVLFVLTLPALAQDIPSTRATLKGIKAIEVVVEEMHPDAERDGLTKTQLVTDVELRLRQARIVVTPLASEFLYVYVNAMKHRVDYFYAVEINISLAQTASLLRAPEIRCVARTWSVSSIQIVGIDRLRDVRSTVADHVDEFIDVYLEQNPKR